MTAAGGSVVSGLAGRYATALFQLARERKSVDAVAADLDRVAEMIDESAELARVVQSPLRSREEHRRVLSAVLAKAEIEGIVANFVGVVAGQRRLFLLPRMIRQYCALAAHARGEVEVEVTSARPLSEQQADALRDRLAPSISRGVRLSMRVDPAVLGGLVVRVGSRMIDSSLRTKLDRLRLVLKEVA